MSSPNAERTHLDSLKWPSAPPLDWVGEAPGDINDSSHCNIGELKKTISLQAERTALLVVDVQPEYWSQCPAVRKDFPEFPDLRATVETCRRKKCAKVIWVRADYRYSHSPWLTQFARIHNLSTSNDDKNKSTTPATSEALPGKQKNMQLKYLATPTSSLGRTLPRQKVVRSSFPSLRGHRHRAQLW